jgi:hypothetical protein
VRWVVPAMVPEGVALLAGKPKLGKAQPIDANVLTPTGWRAMGELGVGDEVIGSNGKPTRVSAVYPQGIQRCYTRTVSGGYSVEATEEHLWNVQTHHQALDYVLMILRYHRPGFDDLPPQERTNLVVDACAHTNELLEALRKLVGFLEHGRANCSRSPLERQAELEAEALGVLYEEVLRCLEEESRRSGEESEHGIREGVAF